MPDQVKPTSAKTTLLGLPSDTWREIANFLPIGEQLRAMRIDRFSYETFAKSHFTPEKQLLVEKTKMDCQKPIFSHGFSNSKNKFGQWIYFKDSKKWNLLNRLFLSVRNGKVDLFESTLKEYQKRYKGKSIFDLLRTTYNYFGEGLYSNIIKDPQCEKYLAIVSKLEPKTKSRKKKSQLAATDSLIELLENAIKFNNYEEVNKLLEDNRELLNNLPDKRKYALLGQTVIFGHLRLFKSLQAFFSLFNLETRLNQDQQNLNLGNYLYNLAVRNGTIEIFNDILNPYFQIADSRGPFLNAIRKNDLTTIKCIHEHVLEFPNQGLETRNYLIDSIIDNGCSHRFFYDAVNGGYVEIAKWIYSQKKNVANSFYYFGLQPLLLNAMSKNNEEMLRFLLDNPGHVPQWHNDKEDVNIIYELTDRGNYKGSAALAVEKNIAELNCSPEIKKLVWLEIAKQISSKPQKSPSDIEVLKTMATNFRYLNSRRATHRNDAVRPLRKIAKIFTFRKYHDRKEVLSEICRPLFGLIRLTLGTLVSVGFSCFIVLAFLLLPVIALISRASSSSLNECLNELKSFYLGSANLALRCINTAILGAFQLATFPLLLIKIPYQAILTYNKGWLSTNIEQKESIQTLVKKAKQKVDVFRNNTPNKIQESYKTLQDLFTNIEMIDGKINKGVEQGKPTSLKLQDEYHQKLKPCISSIGSILFKSSPNEDYLIATEMQKKIPESEKNPIDMVDDYLDSFSPSPVVTSVVEL